MSFWPYGDVRAGHVTISKGCTIGICINGRLYRKRSIGSSLLGIRELLNCNILHYRGLKSSRKGLREL